jgi:hypothetical protein
VRARACFDRLRSAWQRFLFPSRPIGIGISLLLQAQSRRVERGVMAGARHRRGQALAARSRVSAHNPGDGLDPALDAGAAQLS